MLNRQGLAFALLLVIACLPVVSAEEPEEEPATTSQDSPSCTTADTGTYYGEKWVCVAGIVVFMNCTEEIPNAPRVCL